MKLLEMSLVYAQNAETIRARIVELQAAERLQTDPDAAWHLQRRIAELTPLLREARELSRLTAHYYDRSYFKHERYRI